MGILGRLLDILRGRGRQAGSGVREQGKVRWFNNSKGYGFIGREKGEDVFVHYSALAAKGYRSLREGDLVEFEVASGKKGLHAVKVTKVR